MTGVHDLALFVVAGLLLNLTPGPDMAYIGARAAGGGFRAGLAATLGIVAGCSVHTAAAAAGLSVVLATSAAAFEMLRWCGALYLLVAGARLVAGAMQARPAAPVAAPMPAAPAARIVREAFIINVLNPKVALFFLAFLPQFIDADAPAKALSFVLLGTLFNLNSLFVNVPIAWLAARAGRRLRAAPAAARALGAGVGALFVLMAARLAALERPA